MDVNNSVVIAGREGIKGLNGNWKKYNNTLKLSEVFDYSNSLVVTVYSNFLFFLKSGFVVCFLVICPSHETYLISSAYRWWNCTVSLYLPTIFFSSGKFINVAPSRGISVIISHFITDYNLGLLSLSFFWSVYLKFSHFC